MANAEFSVHLGGGLYMDSNGVLSRAVEPGKPTYPTPGGGLPISPDAVEKAFAGIQKALPDPDDQKSRAKFEKILDKVGMAPLDKANLISVLGTIGNIAGTIASVVPYVGAAISILKIFGLFKDGPSPLEDLINRRFVDLERLIRGFENTSKLIDARNQRTQITDALGAFFEYARELKKGVPNASALAFRKSKVRDALPGARRAVTNLLDSSTWLKSFDRAEHNAVWLFIQNLLYCFPKDGGPRRAYFPAQNSQNFDHRYMVPLVIWAVETYLTLLRALIPEFRSTGEERDFLRDFARRLETLAANMRNEGLARTVYTPADFVIPWGLSPDEVIDLSPLGFLGLPAVLSPNCARFPVGALDLRSHNDSYFTPGFTTSVVQFAGPQYAKQGIFAARWIPPAALERYEETIPTVGPESRNRPPATRTRYRITNPDECAAAANAQSERDYTDLLFSSGYMNLIHLIATLRNEATDPDQSQTVRSEAWLVRRAGPSVPVTVKSEPILMSEEITAATERQTMEFGATLDFKTQPLGRDIQLRYRVFLRTLPEGNLFGGSWSEHRYTDYHRVRYIDDTDDPENQGFKKLEAWTGAALDELKLTEGYTSAELRTGKGTAKLTAVTFDWWVPVKTPSFAANKEALANVHALRALGWSPDFIPPPLHFDSPTPDVRDSDIIVWENSKFTSVLYEDSKEPASGLHRKEAKTEIELDYSFQWQGDRLTISLNNNRPLDRNYVVYVVVEETLDSGVVLHTVERVPVVGQLTFVPQSYFDEERAAMARALKALRDFARSYTLSVSDIPRPGDPDPGDRHFDNRLAGLASDLVARDPVLRILQLENFTTVGAMEHLFATAVRHEHAAPLLRLSLMEAEVPAAIVNSLFRKHSVAHAKKKTKPSGDGKVRGKVREISLAAKIVKTKGLRRRPVKIGHVSRA